MNRRGFLAQLLRAVALTAGGAPALRAAAQALGEGAGNEAVQPFSKLQWSTLAAVQEHMLPTEPNSPGAREVNAIGYLRLVLADPRAEAEALDLLRDGVVAIDRQSDARFAAQFSTLDVSKRESLLRAFEQDPQGARWLGEMLDFLLEALLSDPVYGGNTGGVGWSWLGIQPGFPRPPAKPTGASG